MASISDRVIALAQIIGLDIKALLARVPPPGGSSGAVLKKTSSSNYAYIWKAVGEVPIGGPAGYVLKKASSANFATTWVAPADVPAGGAAGQFLRKNSTATLDVSWADVPATAGVPAGGAAGQVLAKASGVGFDTEWVTPATGGGGGGGGGENALMWRGFVSAEPGAYQSPANQVGSRYGYYTNGDAFVRDYYTDYLSPIGSIPDITVMGVPQVGGTAFGGFALGAACNGALFMRQQSQSFKASIRFGIFDDALGRFFVGAVGSHPNGDKRYTGLGFSEPWSAFGSNSGYAGVCIGVGFESTDTNLQFVKMQQSMEPIRIDTGIPRDSVLLQVLDFEIQLVNGATQLHLALKNMVTGLTLASANIALPTDLPSTSSYTLSAGVGNNSDYTTVKLALVHMLYQGQYGPMST